MSKTCKYYYKDKIYETKLMFWFITICVSNLVNLNGFVIQDSFNVSLKDDADYKVDLIITDADYEMIDQKELKEFKIEREKEMFKKLNEMALKAKYRTSQIKQKIENQSFDFIPIVVVNNASNSVISAYIGPLIATTVTVKNKKAIKEEKEMNEYDYDNLVNEYYEEANNESQSKHAYHILKSEIALQKYGTFTSIKKIFTTTNCSEVQDIGLLALKCLIIDFIDQRQPMRELMVRLWRFFQIWFFVYLGVAIPLWCTRGWCCSCLCCKFFKPRQTTDEAKHYLIAYPPGVFQDKNGELTYYEPSEREMQCYKEFEHYIKTL